MQDLLSADAEHYLSSDEAGAVHNRRILLIDDNESIHADYKKILTSSGSEGDLDLQNLSASLFGETKPATIAEEIEFEISSAHQGEEGRDMVRRSLEEGRPFALAFIDMRMPPGWDGLETMERIWDVDPNLQIVICTAYSDNSWQEINDRVKYRERLLILKKPFDSVEVRQLAIALTLKWNLERQAKQKMRAIVETARDGIITFDAEGDIRCCNRSSCQIFGYGREELIGCNMAVLLAEAERLTGSELLAGNQPGAAGEPAAQEMEGRRSDGSSVPLLVSVSSFHTQTGPMYAMIVRDLTEYKLLQRELSQAKKLETFGQMAMELAEGIHDPMKGVSDNLEYLKTSCENLLDVVGAFEQNLTRTGPPIPWDGRVQLAEEIKSTNDFERLREHLRPAIDESLEGVRNVIDVVRTMREFSQRGPAEMAPADINKAVESAVRVTRNRWKEVAEMELELDASLPPISCRLAEINQVLLNLIVNATDAIGEKYDATQQKGRITIRTRAANGAVCVDVEDTGPGIATENLSRIFDPAFTTKAAGTGQGLAITHDVVVTKHSGRVAVDSRPGQGTKFTVELPLA